MARIKHILKYMNGANYKLKTIDRSTREVVYSSAFGVFIPLKKRDFVHTLGTIEGYSATFLTAKKLDSSKINKILVNGRTYNAIAEYEHIHDGGNSLINNMNHSSYKLKEIQDDDFEEEID